MTTLADPDTAPAATTTAEAQVTVSASDLNTILRATRLFTATDDPRPMLRAILIETGGGIITATATNRYIVGHARKPATGQLPGPVLLDRRDAKRVVRMLTIPDAARTAAEYTPVTITVESGHDTDRQVTFTTPYASVAATTVDGTFPKVAVVFDKAATAATSRLEGPINLSPHWFGTFNKVRLLLAAGRDAIHGEPCRLAFTDANTPVRVEIGDWFVGLVMPVKAKSASPTVPFGLPAVEKAEG